MKRMRTFVIAVLALVALAGQGLAAADIGDSAPALQIAKWVKGQPIALKDGLGKTVFVVEFWATWCPPCKTSIPHLTELQKQFADRGVVMVGVSDEPVDTVKPFVDENKKMDYRVVCDDGRKTTEAYMKPRTGIPHAFVVDKRGRVVWTGHPMYGLERAIEQALAGEFDKAKAVKKQELVDQIFAAFSGRGQGAEQAIEALIAQDPKDPDSYRLKLMFLDGTGKSADAAKLRDVMAKTFPKDVRILNEAASYFATVDDLALRAPDRALELARQAVAATQEKDASALVALATAWYALCDIDKAIDAAQKALAVADDADKPEVQTALAFFQKVKKAAAATRP